MRGRDGVTSTTEDPLRRFLAARVAEGWMPGASWWVGRDDRAISHGAVGLTSLDPGADPVGEDTPFDLASLTKALVTAPLALMLEQDGRLALDAPLGRLMPEMRETPYASCTPLSLAIHTTGMPAWWPVYLHASGKDEYLARIAGRPPGCRPGETLYSDLGYLVLGLLIERVGGSKLDRIFRERVAGPLGLTRTGFPRGEQTFADAAATERGNAFERALAGEATSGYSWREEIPRGEVHDANAHGLQGIAGHAGLFGTAVEVARIACELLRPGALGLADGVRRRMLEVVRPSRGRTIGLVTAARASAARGILADEAPGHTGFTGTSFWLEPTRGACFVLLTNRVHPTVPEREFRWLRRGFHRVARGLCGSD